MDRINDEEAAMFKRIRKCFLSFFDFFGREEALKHFEDFKEAALFIDDSDDRRVFLRHRLLSMTSFPSKNRSLGNPKIIQRCFDKIIMAKKNPKLSKAPPGSVFCIIFPLLTFLEEGLQLGNNICSYAEPKIRSTTSIMEPVMLNQDNAYPFVSRKEIPENKQLLKPRQTKLTSSNREDNERLPLDESIGLCFSEANEFGQIATEFGRTNVECYVIPTNNRGCCEDYIRCIADQALPQISKVASSSIYQSEASLFAGDDHFSIKHCGSASAGTTAIPNLLNSPTMLSRPEWDLQPILARSASIVPELFHPSPRPRASFWGVEPLNPPAVHPFSPTLPSPSPNPPLEPALARDPPHNLPGVPRVARRAWPSRAAQPPAASAARTEAGSGAGPAGGSAFRPVEPRARSAGSFAAIHRAAATATAGCH
jgi:hypothetical protein